MSDIGFKVWKINKRKNNIIKISWVNLNYFFMYSC